MADSIATSLKRLPAVRLPAFVNIEPVIAELLAVAFRRERIAPPPVASGAIIRRGVFLPERG